MSPALPAPHHRTRTLAPVLLFAAMLAVGCAGPAEPVARESATGTASWRPSSPSPTGAATAWTGPALGDRGSGDWEVQVVSDELRYPWEVRRAGDALVVTEVAGTIAMIDATGLHRYPVRTTDPVVHDGGSGLLGLDLARDFLRSGTAYAYYTYDRGAGLTNRVVELGFDGEAWSERRVLLDGIAGHQLYNGGRVAIGPDGHLYVTTGWADDEARPQDVGDLAGKILRLDLDGRPAPGNPFPWSPVYTYGHRNPQGLAWDGAGRLFSAEHGQSAADEINLIEPGANYGWPVVQGSEARNGFAAPYLDSGAATWAPSGVAFAGNELLVSGLRGEVLYVLDADRAALDGLFSSDERVRSVLPDDDRIYLTTTNTSPRGGGEQVPDRLISLRLRS